MDPKRKRTCLRSRKRMMAHSADEPGSERPKSMLLLPALFLGALGASIAGHRNVTPPLLTTLHLDRVRFAAPGTKAKRREPNPSRISIKALTMPE
jgi:hypothetical protein